MSARSTGARTAAERSTATASGARTTARTAGRPSARTTAPGAMPTRPELRLVAGEDQARPRRPLPAVSYRRAPFVLLVIALLVGTTLGLLVLNTAIAVDSLKATALRSANAQRAQEVQRLQQQVITAGTPEQVAADAARAGLVPAGTPGFLVIGPDGRSTVRGAPAPAARPSVPPAGTPPPVPAQVAATPGTGPAGAAPTIPAPAGG